MQVESPYCLKLLYTVVTCCYVALGDTWCCCGMLPKALDELEKGHQPQAHESDAQTAKLSEKSGGMSTSASAPNYYYLQLKRVHL